MTNTPVFPLHGNLPCLTMGCPVGIGPELVLRLMHRRLEKGLKLPLVVGDIGVLEKAAAVVGLALTFHPWNTGSVPTTHDIQVVEASRLDASALQWGEPNQQTGKAMGAYIETAVRLISQGRVAGMVTCPITKTSLNLAGYPFPGHTEMLASLTGTKQFRMMMAGPRLKVVLVTIHLPLADVATCLHTRAVLDCITMTVNSLREDFAVQAPRVAVAGLNPHAGERGLFGREEETVITPAIKAYQGPGQISGPWPPDTVFLQAHAGEFDAVVAMYHDQGLIPFKLVHFSDGVNVTLGLPIVRTSVDHGTAYDIAGQAVASEESLVAAFDLAVEIIANRKRGMKGGKACVADC
ncbi:MAG: 4-hydroxythreonine-4-phosphate dehydrogenase PdxA [Desulfobulbus propionicus]|nr:MAG: 4-hydroxythreonine-4-phosphate dehydrogenase PdxA [Desulfobulbus propionicus]